MFTNNVRMFNEILTSYFSAMGQAADDMINETIRQLPISLLYFIRFVFPLFGADVKFR